MVADFTKKSRFNRFFLISGLFSILSLAAVMVPFAKYTYNSVAYQLTGLELITGKRIMGGTVYIEPVKSLIAMLVIGVLALIISAAALKGIFSEKRSCKLLLLFGFIQIICCMMFLIMLSSILTDVRKPGTQFGVYLTMLFIGLGIIWAVIKLYRLKYLSVLDFMILPGLSYFLINNYLPMAGISIAFMKIDYAKGLWNSSFVGFENFKYLFSSSDAFIITRNTLLYNAAFIVIGNTMGILVGICLSEVFSKRLQKTYQTLILLPQLISMVIVAYIVLGFLSSSSGFINKAILGGNPIDFYSQKAYWPFILIFVNSWKGLGYSSIIYLSSIIGIDRSFYEAATIDGCGRMGLVKYITLPLLKPTIFTLVILAVGRIFYSDFGLFYQVPMDAGALYPVTNTIDTYVYRSLMRLNNVSMASAASAYQAIVGFVIVLTFNLIVRKTNKEHALF